ncbi:hypothetical protein GF352_04220 [archaeon]|nr:hypothetical protein [archaeon]
MLKELTKEEYLSLFKLIQENTEDLEGRVIKIQLDDNYFFISYKTGRVIKRPGSEPYQHKTGHGYNYDSANGYRTAILIKKLTEDLSEKEMTSELISIYKKTKSQFGLNNKYYSKFKSWKKKVSKGKLGFIIKQGVNYRLIGPVKLS